MDGIRAVAILSVFFHHALHIKLLWMGVDLFFVLSGFLITGVLLDAKHHSLRVFFAQFYSRRARRILPPYLLLLLVVSLVYGIAWLKYWYFYVLLTNFIPPLHVPHPEAFTPLWSLAVEEQFYLVWPFAVYFLNNQQLRWVCILLTASAPVLRGVFHFGQHWPVYMLTPFRMDLLAVGGLLCLEWRERRERIVRWGVYAGPLITAVGLVAIAVLSKFGYTTYSNTRAGNVLIYEACLFIAVGAMIFVLGGRGVGLLRWEPVIYIGKISYSMYLVHMGVILIIFSKLHGWAGVVVSLALTIGYAAISWSALENRLLRRRDSAPGGKLTAV